MSSERFTRLPRTQNAWNTGYRCAECGWSTGYWPDDGSAEADIYGHLSEKHPAPEED